MRLHAFPAISAPKTGFALAPRTRFFSKKEVIDSDGVMWLKVSDESFFDQSSVKGDVCYDGNDPASIIGASVVRGKDWRRGDQDGGRGTKGAIVSAQTTGYVVVEWDDSSRLYNYAATASRHELAYAPATPPPQGWACFRPLGPGSPAIATLARSPFRCFSCGDGLVSPRVASCFFKPADKIETGDQLYVASTLEAVKVESITSDRVYCSFSLKDKEQHGSVSREDCIWYRPEDLIAPFEHGKNNDSSGDTVVIGGIPRTRRELVMLFGGDVTKAKAAWEEASKEAGQIAIDDDCSFASCARGHLLHARCLQGALLNGQSCPSVGCNEPLYLPQIRIQQDETVCCSGRDDNDEAEVEALQAAAEIADHPPAATGSDDNQADEHEFISAGITGLRMCPSCCAGPLMNTECSDMRAHHGQCTAYALGGEDGNSSCTPDGVYQVPASQIMAEMMKLADGQSVADVLPRCPTHNVIVMFNGEAVNVVV